MMNPVLLLILLSSLIYMPWMAIALFRKEKFLRARKRALIQGGQVFDQDRMNAIDAELKLGLKKIAGIDVKYLRPEDRLGDLSKLSMFGDVALQYLEKRLRKNRNIILDADVSGMTIEQLDNIIKDKIPE